MTEQVKYWEWDTARGAMVDRPDGYYVETTDYDALQSQLEEAVEHLRIIRNEWRYVPRNYGQIEKIDALIARYEPQQ